MRALIVEDEALVAALLAEMLTDLGIIVIGTAYDLEQAVEMARSEIIDLAILDLKLQGQETYAVASILAAREIPFAFATGYGRERLVEQYRQYPVLQKPFNASELNAMISRLCSEIAGC